MLKTRLETVSCDLVDEIEKASDAQRRAISGTVAALAVRRCGLSDPSVETGLLSLKSGSFGPGPVPSAIAQVVEALDNRYFQAQELFEAGQGEKATYQDLFAKARAASAVLFALGPDAFQAAAESVYEAVSALGIDEPRSVVSDILG